MQGKGWYAIPWKLWAMTGNSTEDAKAAACTFFAASEIDRMTALIGTTVLLIVTI